MPLLAGLGPLGVPELLIIAFIIVLIFGVGRLTDVGGALGKSVREFRKATHEDDEGAADSSTMGSASGASPASTLNSIPSSSAPAAGDAADSTDARFCAECGARNTRSAKFCAECGHTMGVAAG